MKTLSKDARGFIDGVTSYIRSDAHAKQVLPKVSALFTKVTSAAKKERVASVSTCVAPTENEKEAVTKMLERILGHEVECKFTVHEELVGGMKIQVADWVVDTSLSSQLASMSESLI